MVSASILRASRLAAMLLPLLLAGGIAGQDATPTDGGKKDGKDKDKNKPKAGEAATTPAAGPPAPTSQGLIPFGKMLPLGEKHLVLEIPSFKEGAPSSTVKAASMMRMDDENMYLEKMDIRMYGPPSQPDKDMRVQLRTAIYHMPSQILASDERSRVSRADFDLQGDTLIFDPNTGQGRMVGNVKMVIFDASSFTKSGPAAEAAAEDEKKKAKEKDKKGAKKAKPESDGTSPEAGTPSTPPKK